MPYITRTVHFEDGREISIETNLRQPLSVILFHLTLSQTQFAEGKAELATMNLTRAILLCQQLRGDTVRLPQITDSDLPPTINPPILS